MPSRDPFCSKCFYFVLTPEQATWSISISLFIEAAYSRTRERPSGRVDCFGTKRVRTNRCRYPFHEWLTLYFRLKIRKERKNYHTNKSVRGHCKDCSRRSAPLCETCRGDVYCKEKFVEQRLSKENTSSNDYDRKNDDPDDWFSSLRLRRGWIDRQWSEDHYCSCWGKYGGNCLIRPNKHCSTHGNNYLSWLTISYWLSLAVHCIADFTIFHLLKYCYH